MSSVSSSESALWDRCKEGVFLVDENGLKLLACVFLPDVLCSYRKDAKFGVMSRCYKCPQYERFMREMDEEDERVMDEIDEERESGVSE